MSKLTPEQRRVYTRKLAKLDQRCAELQGQMGQLVGLKKKNDQLIFNASVENQRLNNTLDTLAENLGQVMDERDQLQGGDSC